ncbi:MAG TPA: RNA polymerase sigma factor [Sandaracinaceae bacterium LLY-WYZ-13_1]|nr:RNA polymerase sigma factor [Sandaracinaceae bacterium LLY-WYZ-13_1]
MQVDFSSDEWLARERELIARARRGERDAVAALYRAFAPRLFATVLMPRLGNRQAAEDALSETFRTALERLPQFDDQGVSLYFWLSRIAVNKATDMHRVKARTRRALTSFEELLAPLRPSAPRPEKELLEEERCRVLRDTVSTVLEGINPRYARAITLRFLEDRSRADCAAAMDVKIGTFDVVLLRALRAFRKAWDAHGDATEAREQA